MNGIRMPIERGILRRAGLDRCGGIESKHRQLRADQPSGPQRTAKKGFGGSIGEFRVFDRVISEEEARLAASWPAIAAAASKDGRAADRAREGRAEALLPDGTAMQGYKALSAEFARVSAEHRAIELRSHTAMVMEERTDSKAERAPLVSRDVRPASRECSRREPRRSSADGAAAAAKPARPGAMDRRSRNPLFARVTVNRLWQEMFGAGLLESADDFGAQAQPPSHPELLDWLAVEFRESGWDVKKLLTLIVTSATYRQAAAISPEKLRSRSEEHPAVARARASGLDGEVVRDSALAASGLLVTKLGGPPRQSPTSLPGVWEGTSMVSSNTRYYTAGFGRVAVSPQSVHVVETARLRPRRWISSTARRERYASSGAIARTRRCRPSSP
jgi:hypothetical protein